MEFIPKIFIFSFQIVFLQKVKLTLIFICVNSRVNTFCGEEAQFLSSNSNHNLNYNVS